MSQTQSAEGSVTVEQYSDFAKLLLDLGSEATDGMTDPFPIEVSARVEVTELTEQ